MCDNNGGLVLMPTLDGCKNTRVPEVASSAEVALSERK